MLLPTSLMLNLGNENWSGGVLASRNATSRSVPSATGHQSQPTSVWVFLKCSLPSGGIKDVHALHQYQFYVLGKNAGEGASDRYSLNGNQWLSAAFGLCWKMTCSNTQPGCRK